ncbi:hypothetical protein EVAR_30070_1 [Eumeta japonica]|uniref:Uncharacterized protein n=1 Tax=Eumeta variegata TaxID=151549 RepID=A0A4C1X7P0_EUMVA|nr:hypothetical protein EVAR_30070_1 [Eumeta japonica]
MEMLAFVNDYLTFPFPLHAVADVTCPLLCRLRCRFSPALVLTRPLCAGCNPKDYHKSRPINAEHSTYVTLQKAVILHACWIVEVGVQIEKNSVTPTQLTLHLILLRPAKCSDENTSP